MTPQFVIAPRAVSQLADVWAYLKRKAGPDTADRVEAAIRAGFAYLALHPQAGHRRSDLAADPVRFLRVFSYFIVFRPDRKPLEIVAVLHGKRNVQRLLIRPYSQALLDPTPIAPVP